MDNDRQACPALSHCYFSCLVGCRPNKDRERGKMAAVRQWKQGRGLDREVDVRDGEATAKCPGSSEDDERGRLFAIAAAAPFSCFQLTLAAVCC